MTNYREILRLHSLGLNKTEIASSCRCARNTVAATLQRAANCGLQWPLPEEMSDKQLSERLFPSSTSKPVYKMPDYASVHKELQRSGVNNPCLQSWNALRIRSGKDKERSGLHLP